MTYAIADETSLVPGAALIPVSKAVQVGQLASELKAVLAVDFLPVVLDTANTPDDYSDDVLYIGPVDAPWPLDEATVAPVIDAHAPQVHYFYTDLQKWLHDIQVKTNAGTALTQDESADQMRALMAYASGNIPQCSCTSPVLAQPSTRPAAS